MPSSKGTSGSLIDRQRRHAVFTCVKSLCPATAVHKNFKFSSGRSHPVSVASHLVVLAAGVGIVVLVRCTALAHVGGTLRARKAQSVSLDRWTRSDVSIDSRQFDTRRGKTKENATVCDVCVLFCWAGVEHVFSLSLSLLPFMQNIITNCVFLISDTLVFEMRTVQEQSVGKRKTKCKNRDRFLVNKCTFFTSRAHLAMSRPERHIQKLGHLSSTCTTNCVRNPSYAPYTRQREFRLQKWTRGTDTQATRSSGHDSLQSFFLHRHFCTSLCLNPPVTPWRASLATKNLPQMTTYSWKRELSIIAFQRTS